MKRYDYVWQNSRIGQVTDGEYVLYSEAQARIEALEWLCEVYAFITHCSCPPMYHYARLELYATLEAARAAGEGE